MARGAAEFEKLFPGLLADMVDAGVPMLENRPDCIHFGAAGHVLGTRQRLQHEFTAYVPSRPRLEWQIRRRATALPNVSVRHQAVDELVVDATGRGTWLPAWLAQWGFDRPREDSVAVGIGYAAHRLRIPDGLIDEKVVVAGASRAQPVGMGLLCYEDGLWTLTAFGVGKVTPPEDFGAMCALADHVLPAHLAAAVRKAEPVGEVSLHKYPASRWRRFDRMDRFPAGILPFGDAVVSFNPTFGQGMTMTSLQAGHLRRALENPDGDLAAAFLASTTKTTYPPRCGR